MKVNKIFKKRVPSFYLKFVTLLVVGVSSVYVGKSFAGVSTVSPNNLEVYIQKNSSEKPLVVFFSSTDKQCGFCIQGNRLLQDAKKSLSDDYNFVQINFNPWKSISTYTTLRAHFSDLGFPINGLPTAVIYYQNKARLHDSGAKKEMIENLRNVVELAKTTKGVTSDKPMSATGGFKPSYKEKG